MNKKAVRITLYTIIILILPVLLIYFDIVPFKYRSLVLYSTVLAVILGVVTEKMSLNEIGIRTDNLKQTFLPYFLFNIIALIIVIWHARNTGKIPLENWWKIPYFQFIFIPTSIVQEFIYRSFFQTQYQKILNPVITILVIAVLYSFMHILWNSAEFLVMTLIGGIVWGILWYKYPNLIWMSASHSILNFFINYYGYIIIGEAY